jgi:hypothetical protein
LGLEKGERRKGKGERRKGKGERGKEGWECDVEIKDGVLTKEIVTGYLVGGRLHSRHQIDGLLSCRLHCSYIASSRYELTWLRVR